MGQANRELAVTESARPLKTSTALQALARNLVGF